jgi:hypothetical protein
VRQEFLFAELEKIRQTYGAITKSIVVNAARDEDHPLHNEFEWDDAIGGEKHREEQAAKLIRSVRVVYKPATETATAQTVRRYVSVARPEGRTYEPVEKIAQDDIVSALVLAEMEREVKALHRKYAHMQEYIDLLRQLADGEAA